LEINKIKNRNSTQLIFNLLELIENKIKDGGKEQRNYTIYQKLLN